MGLTRERLAEIRADVEANGLHFIGVNDVWELIAHAELTLPLPDNATTENKIARSVVLLDQVAKLGGIDTAVVTDFLTGLTKKG